MTDIIEQDALKSTPETAAPLPRDHPAEGSFVAMPRMDPTLFQKVRSLFTTDLKPGVHVIHKEANAPRYMFIITSNSYMDREDETITSAALKSYEDSCYPGDGLFHCDNPLLWWHDDDVPMGKIVAVNYSEPFLIEIAEELDDPVSKVLWDFAETNGDNAGASHRFGYREKDRLPNGDYTRIYKQESTYLPERNLAANGMTYAGVMTSMATPQSDKRLNEIFEKATGISDVAAKLHGQSSERAKLLSELRGLTHKAAKAEGDLESEVVEEVVDEAVEEGKIAPPADMGKWVNTVNQIYSLVMELVETQQGSMTAEVELAKGLKALEDANTKQKARETSLEQMITAQAQRVEILEKRLSLSPRSVTQDKGTTPEAIKAAVEAADKARGEEGLIDTPFGKLKPAPKS